MSDGYQVGVLSLINVCFSKIYGDAYTSEMSTRLGNALFVGIVLGQVSFFLRSTRTLLQSELICICNQTCR